MKTYFVYIIANHSRMLYTGVTSALERRTGEHKGKAIPGFSKKYNLCRLVYFEETNDIRAAIAREKQIKGWLRKKKVALIESANPTWKDLSQEPISFAEPVLSASEGLRMTDGTRSRRHG
ncbi:MAG: GIY-YIG nuclease family protein [Nitrospinota bacterium]